MRETVTYDQDTSVTAGDLVVAVGNGQLITQRIAVPGEVTIGREPGCELVIDHNSLSRRHAVLAIDAHGAATIRDLGSTNGTRVGDALVRGGASVALGAGGFRIGPYAFMLVARRPGAELSRTGSELLRVDDPTPEGVSRTVRDFAVTDVNMLITGETGVGKEVLAATVHALSRRTGDLVQINCAALSESLLESELFGHERGAFTGAVAARRGLVEAAHDGTLLLDEIGEIPLATQAKLLRVIERREVVRLGATQPTAVNVRFLAATNRDLPAEVARGAFRADLFYRLDGVTLTIPPLRERVGAIVPLAMQFLAARAGVTTPIEADAVAALEDHVWPGNVRELKAVIERAAVLAASKPIGARHLTFRPVATAAATAPAPTGAHAEERDRIVRALADCAGNQTRAAAALGMSRTTLVTKIRVYGIPRPSAK
jgi:DNA-binding NtrC family response regulator|nr:sigma 54-interacting transcriptional regulator [Kofleriaceae bacterium]